MAEAHYNNPHPVTNSNDTSVVRVAHCRPGRFCEDIIVYKYVSFSFPLAIQYPISCSVIMPGVAFLWYSLALIAALQEQSRFFQGNIGAYAQSPSPADGKLKITCEKIARSISSKSQVFYPGELSSVSGVCNPPWFFRFPGVQLGHLSLGQLEFTSPRVHGRARYPS